MLSKYQISLLKSLHQKKGRSENPLFLVEGYKSIIEFIESPYLIEAIYHIAPFDPKMLNLSRNMNLYVISATEMEKISTLKTPQDVIAVVKIPVWDEPDRRYLEQRFSIVLDGIQDPGNMGTIIRTADWFGIGDIICSTDTVDAYNPKVVQASMGSLSRVKVYYTNLVETLPKINLPVFGAMLNGENIYETNFGAGGLLLMGNEGNGIRPGLTGLITRAVTIPRTGKAESLNVAIATALFCSEISRNANIKLTAKK
jgi:TrmH family RNA methyltransferase